MALPKAKGQLKHRDKNNKSIEHSLMAAPSDPFVQEDEIDLAELFSGLWAQKALIAGVALLCATLSMVYAFRATPNYKAVAVFEITKNSSQPSLSTELNGLASLAGLDVTESSENLGVFDRIAGRDFVLQVADDLALDQDPYFNPYAVEMYSPSLSDRIKDRITRLVGAEKMEVAEDRLAEDKIVKRFNKFVTAKTTENGSIEVSAVHRNPDRAADLANRTMNRVLAALDSERKDGQAKQLAYLSEQLGDALTEMNDAQEKVQNFALENSLVSTSAFTTRTELMFRLRDELKRSQEMSDATDRMLSLVESGAPLTQNDYAALRGAFPIVDDVAFRRLLGIPEALDQWTWPDRPRLLEFKNIILDRAARARRELEQMQAEAENYARASEELIALKRNASIAEATYQLLIEQTKSQTFAAGFNSDLAKIYQVAVPPAIQSSPIKTLVVALGMVLGVLLGMGLAIQRNSRRGRLFSASAIRLASQPGLFVRTPLRFLRSRKVGELLDRFGKVQPAGLASVAIDLNKKSPKGILCVSAGSQTRASGPALWIAAHLARDGKARVAVVDLSGELRSSGAVGTNTDDELWRVSPLSGNIDLLTPAAALRGEDLLLRSGFREDVGALMTSYDRIVFSAAPDHATMAHRALHSLGFYLVAICSGRLARKSILTELREIAPIDACLSET